jgi:SAM-dependent methyltransferase
MSPLANAYVAEADLASSETFYPLRALVCDGCLLVQLEEFEPPSVIFSDYLYFSSYSSSWLDHSRRFADQMVAELELGPSSRVVEIASNDGYLLQYFLQKGIPVLGIEPSANVAAEAIQRGLPTLVDFFGQKLAKDLRERWRADLLVANNVMPHVPDLNEFVAGMSILLAPRGTLTIEFGHLLSLIEKNQFDTIYHEHFSYLSLHTARRILNHHRLEVFDVEELPTHGGSLRLYVRHIDETDRAVRDRVHELLRREIDAGLERPERYSEFAQSVRVAKREILTFFIEQSRAGRSVAGYGAPAKATTLLNYCGIGTEFLEYTVDLSPHKQGRWIPGRRVAIHDPSRLRETRPDVVLILPWNLREEVTDKHSYIRDWGGRFAVTQPNVSVF